LLPVAGKPVIEYVLDAVTQAGLAQDDIYIATVTAFERDFVDYCTQSEYPQVKVIVEQARHEAEKPGALAGLLAALEDDEDYLLLAGDNVFDFELKDLLAVDSDAVVTLYDIQDIAAARMYGLATIDDQRFVKSFVEKPSKPQSTLISTACYFWRREFGLRERLMDYLQQGGSPDAIGRFLAWLVEGQMALKAYVASGQWFDIGDRQSYLRANQSFMIGKNSLDPTSEVLGDAIVRSSVGRRSHVRNSVIKNSILLDDVQVSDCAITNSVVDNYSKLTGLTLHDSAVGRHTVINGSLDCRHD
jgi:NDP-sugar pyrophosphorylase family protein